MVHDWFELSRITQGSAITIEKVKINKSGIAVEGSFELPPLAQLTMQDQIFIIAFIKTHGSIKEMEKLFEISYPTVKNRLNRIAEQLEFVEIVPPSTKEDILDMLGNDELSVAEAIDKLRGKQ
jgi:hypothetical protein